MSETVRRFERIDASALKSPIRMDNGFLKVEGRIARVGIQEYRDGSGKVRRELRLPEEVFDAASLESFHLVPVTNTHPPVMLTARNTKDYQVGHVGENVRKDGDWVAAPIMITDAEAIGAAERGRSQLSNGYTCELDSTQDPALIAQYGKYDACQRRIRGNHLALVDSARAGAGASLRLDSGDAISGDFGPQENIMLPSSHKGRNAMHALKIDGFTFNTDDANAQAVIDRVIAQVKKEGDDKVASALTAKADAEKVSGELKVKLDMIEEKAKADAERMVKCDECDGEGKDEDGEECDACDGKGKIAAKNDCAEHRAASIERQIKRGIQKRAALVLEAQEVLGKNEKLDKKDETEIHKLVVGKLVPKFKLDGLTPGEVLVAYNTARASAGKQPHATETVAVVAPKSEDKKDEKPSDPQEAYRRQNARILEMNRKK